jgi:aspartate kinase
VTTPLVLKFGGTSVADAEAYAGVANIVARRVPTPQVVVVSALGGVTDQLVEVAAGRLTDVTPLFERHRALGAALLDAPAQADLERHLETARRDLDAALAAMGNDRPRHTDAVLALGERLSSALGALVLTARGVPARMVDARRAIVTDNRHGEARVSEVATRTATRAVVLPVLAEGVVPVLGGFIAATPEGITTTIGRGGSDVTAALVGAALDAPEIEIWTDVPGILTADPRFVPEAWTIPVLSYAEAAELAYFGAKVLHPQTLRPAMDRGIPVRVLSARAPDRPGTLVTREGHDWPGAVKAIAHRRGIRVIQVTSERMLGAHGFLRAIFEVFDRHERSVDVVTTSEVSVSITVDDRSPLDAIIADLAQLGSVELEPARAVVCVVGEGLRTTPGVAGRVFQAVGSDCNVTMISQGASRVNLTFVVGESEVGAVVSRLHSALLGAGRPQVPRVAAVGAAGAEGHDVLRLTRELVDIPSVSGDEREVTEFVGGRLEALGYHVELFDAAPGRPNLFATTGEAPKIVFCTHLDTVPPFVQSSEDEDHLYGRGVTDAKGSVAAAIVACERLRAAGEQRVGLLLVADEEQGSVGARAANAHPRAADVRYMIVGEPTGNRLAVGSRGSLQFRLKATSPGGHSSVAHGASAVHQLMEGLARLRAASWPVDPFFGPTTLNVGVFHGGTRPNVLAEDASADVQFRLSTPSAEIEPQIIELVGPGITIEWGSRTPPARLPGVPGYPTCVVGFTSDVPHLSNWGTRLLCGPGSIDDAHVVGERIIKAQLHEAVERYTQLATALLAGVEVDEGVLT